MDTIKPRNWAEFQHYKDRRPSWIKLHRDLLDNLEYHTLSDRAAKCLVLLWLVASEDSDGRIDANPAKLAFRLRITKQEAESVTKELVASGFMIDGSGADTQQGPAKATAKSVADANGFGSRHIPDSVKRLVWVRDGGTCRLCGAKEHIEYDHIHPVSKGGGSTADNIQLLCRQCNRRKRVSTSGHVAAQSEQGAAQSEQGAAQSEQGAAQSEHSDTLFLGSRSLEKEKETEKQDQDQKLPTTSVSSADADDSPSDETDEDHDDTGDHGDHGDRKVTDLIPYQKLVDLYNERCGDLFPKVSKLTDKRRRKIRSAWKFDTNNPDERRRTNVLEYWGRYFDRCTQIEHFRKAAEGEYTGTHAGWMPGFDFLICEDTWLGVREGRYALSARSAS